MFKVTIRKSYVTMEFLFDTYGDAAEFQYTLLMNRVEDEDDVVVTINPVKGEEQ